MNPVISPINHPSPFMRPQWARPGHWGWVGGLRPTASEPCELFTSPTAPQTGQLLLFLSCLQEEDRLDQVWGEMGVGVTLKRVFL